MTAATRKRARQEEESADAAQPMETEEAPLSPPSSTDRSTSACPPSDGLGHSLHHRRQALLYQLSPLYLPPTLPSLSSQRASLFDLLDRTLTTKANNAALLVGYPGSGKSVVVQSVLLDLHRRHAPLGRSFAVVRLDGRLHSDDTVAMRELVRQLTVDLELEPPSATADFAVLLGYLRDILASAFASTAVVFVLDHMELMAVGKAKQTLLYNVSNLLQEDYQLAVVGLTQRIDCFDALEKRIKSRFAAQRLHFSPCSEEADIAQTITDRLVLTREGLVKALGERSRHDFDFIPGETVEGIERVKGLSAAVQRHNEAVEAALKDEALLRLMRHQLQLGRSVRWFLTWVVSNRHPTSQRVSSPLQRLFLLTIPPLLSWCADQCRLSADRGEAVSQHGSVHVSATTQLPSAPCLRCHQRSLSCRVPSRAVSVRRSPLRR